MAVVHDDRATLADLHQASDIRNGLAQSIKLLVTGVILDNREVARAAREVGGAKQLDTQGFVLDRGRNLGRGRNVEDIALLDDVVNGTRAGRSQVRIRDRSEVERLRFDTRR